MYTYTHTYCVYIYIHTRQIVYRYILWIYIYINIYKNTDILYIVCQLCMYTSCMYENQTAGIDVRTSHEPGPPGNRGTEELGLANGCLPCWIYIYTYIYIHVYIYIYVYIDDDNPLIGG